MKQLRSVWEQALALHHSKAIKAGKLSAHLLPKEIGVLAELREALNDSHPLGQTEGLSEWTAEIIGYAIRNWAELMATSGLTGHKADVPAPQVLRDNLGRAVQMWIEAGGPKLPETK